MGWWSDRRADRLERRAADAYDVGDLATAEMLIGQALALRQERAARSEPVASALNLLGRIAQDRGRAELAEQRFRAALTAADDERSPEAGNAWNNLGRLAFGRGRLDEAVTCYERARVALESSDVDGDPRPAVAVVLNNLGTVHDARGELDTALARFIEAQAYAGATNPGLEVTTWNNIGGIRHSRGELDLAEDAYRTALGAAERARLPAAGVVAMGNVGHVRLELGDIATALTCYRGALDTAEAVRGPDSGLAADQHANLARAHLAAGELDLAAEHAARAESIDAASAPDSTAYARDLGLLAQLAQATGELGHALRHLRGALAVHERVAPTSAGTANALNNLGVLHHDRGDLALALDLYERALTVQERIAPRAVTTAAMHNNAGAAARALGDPDGALHHLRTALEIDRAAAPRSAATAVDLSNLGTLHCQTGDLQLGRSYLGQAAELDDQVAPGSLAAAAAAANLAWADLRLGDVDAAEAGLRRALAIGEALAPTSDRVVNDLTVLADVHRVRGRPVEQLACLRRAAEIVEVLRLRSGSTPAAREQALAERFQALHRLVAALVDAAAEDEAFHVADRARGRVLADLLVAHGVRPPSAPDDLVAAGRALRARLAATFRSTAAADAGLGRERRRLEDEIEQVEERLRIALPRYRELTAPPGIDRRGLQAVLGDDETALTFTVTDDEVIAWVVTRTAVALRRLACPRARLDELVADARADRTGALARELLWPLLGPSVPPRLTVIPDGALALVPWDGLPLPDGALLVERSVLSSAPSALVLAQLRRRSPRSGGAVSFAGFGPPAGDSPIPATRAELRGIVDLVRATDPDADVSVHLGAEVTRAAVTAAAPGHRFVHFATHGIVNDVNPLHSGLLVADSDDDLLAAHELVDLALDADVVTCSACDTGLGRVRPGEGVVGLGRALLAAGTRSVVLTLAPVPDRPAARLMVGFYRHLLAGRAPAEALTEAKREVLRQRPHLRRRPAAWAPFVLLGAG